MYFCESQRSFAQVICGRQTEVFNPHEVVAAIFPQPVQQSSFIIFVVPALICFMFPDALGKQFVYSVFESIYVRIRESSFPFFLPLFPVMDRVGYQIFQLRCPFMFRYFCQLLQIPLQVLVAFDVGEDKICIVVIVNDKNDFT